MPVADRGDNDGCNVCALLLLLGSSSGNKAAAGDDGAVDVFEDDSDDDDDGGDVFGSVSDDDDWGLGGGADRGTSGLAARSGCGGGLLGRCGMLCLFWFWSGMSGGGCDIRLLRSLSPDVGWGGIGGGRVGCPLGFGGGRDGGGCGAGPLGGGPGRAFMLAGLGGRGGGTSGCVGKLIAKRRRRRRRI